ncbi:peptidoglycan-binding protein [Cellulomonas endophytica]|uniref:peptidoglycan-binding protein n=1 Tax=Cellulomonas endophytica TaxID=2494735 RepID=UPI0010122D38|nr:peptidoglycan-binding protein [Cellulomonas endophytica]
MVATADAVVAAAASQIGYFVRPGGVTKFGSWYGLPQGQWCAMFVSWSANEAGALDIIPKHAYTPSGVAWFQARGRWHGGPAGIRRGDVLYFDFPGGPRRVSHVGLVESVAADGSVLTIEGNTAGPGGEQRNGGACLRKRRRSWIVGYGRPDYAGGGGAPVQAQGVSADHLARGHRGAAVSELQRRLAALGHDLGPAGADGDLGARTEAALVAFQRSAGLEADGVYGPRTRAALEAATSAAAAPAPTPAAGLALDGVRGPRTVSRWQEVMGTPVDGVLSRPSAVVAADQRFLNASVPAADIAALTGKPALVEDGDEGPRTATVRQHRLRACVDPALQQLLLGGPLAVDGVLGPQTHTLHQAALNRATPGSGTYGPA